jgi:hypothetical protein
MRASTSFPLYYDHRAERGGRLFSEPRAALTKVSGRVIGAVAVSARETRRRRLTLVRWPRQGSAESGANG